VLCVVDATTFHSTYRDGVNASATAAGSAEGFGGGGAGGGGAGGGGAGAGGNLHLAQLLIEQVVQSECVL
jgi:hypothetical protein